MEIPEDKRKRLRLDFNTRVSLTFQNPDQVLTATMKNISMNGIFVETDQMIPLDTPCGIEVVITAPLSRLRRL